MAAKEEIIDIDFLEKRIKYLESIRDKYVLLQLDRSQLVAELAETAKELHNYHSGYGLTYMSCNKDSCEHIRLVLFRAANSKLIQS